MTTKTSPVVYLTPSSESEREALAAILAPHSWADGEFGLMLTDAAFDECVHALPTQPEGRLKMLLVQALEDVRSVGAGDVCLNFGLVS